LVQAGVKINHINNLGWTALHEAIILGDGSGRYVDTVRVLVAAGADLQLPSQRDEISPIEHATAKGHNEIAQVLRTALDAEKPPKRRALSTPSDAVRLRWHAFSETPSGRLSIRRMLSGPARGPV
jgi:ankyrin repeat protein